MNRILLLISLLISLRFLPTNKLKTSSESLHKSHIGSNNGHDQADEEIQRGNGIVQPLILGLADLRPLHVQQRRNDGHERRTPDRSRDADHRRQVIKEDGHGHAGEHHHHGDQGELPVLYTSRLPRSLTGVLQLEGLHDDLAHRVAVQREGEAQRERDDETAHQDVGIQSGVRVQHVRRGIAAESEVAREGVEQIKDQNEQIGEEHHHAHALPRGTLHLADDRNELHLRTMPEAEDREHHEQVLVHDETLQRAAERTGLAALAVERALLEARVVRQRRVRFDHALARLAREVGDFGQTAGVRAQSTDQHHDGDVDDAGDGDHRGVTQSGDFSHQRRREDHTERNDDEQPGAIGQELQTIRNHLSFGDKRHAKVELVRNDDCVTAAGTDTIKELRIVQRPLSHLNHIYKDLKPVAIHVLGNPGVGALLRVIEDFLKHHVRETSEH